MRFTLTAAIALVCGCGGASGAISPIVVSPAAYDASVQTLRQLTAGDVIDLVQPPQGGFVLFIGAEAQGLTDGHVNLEARLKDLQSGDVAFEDHRDVQLVRDSSLANAWKTDVSSYTAVANVTTCPTPGAASVNAAQLNLQVVVVELASGRLGSTTILVTPQCRQTDPTQLALCQCECAGNYVVGKCGHP